MSKADADELLWITKHLDDANVPKYEHESAPPTSPTLRVLTLISQRDEARKLAAEAQSSLESARLQLDCCSKGCGTDEQYACRRCCRVMLANYAANHGARCDVEQERLSRLVEETAHKLENERHMVQSIVEAARAMLNAWRDVPGAHSYQRDTRFELMKAINATEADERPMRCICGHEHARHDMQLSTACLAPGCSCSRWGLNDMHLHAPPNDTPIGEMLANLVVDLHALRNAPTDVHGISSTVERLISMTHGVALAANDTRERLLKLEKRMSAKGTTP